MNWAYPLSQVFRPMQGEANLYGAILYSERDPHLAQLLRDDDYWSALHKLSGPRWKIFAVRAFQGCVKPSDGGPGHLGMMVAVWEEPTANEELLESFKIRSTEYLPLLAIFACDDAGQVSQTTVRIRGNSKEELFLSIRGILETIASALEGVAPKYRQESTRAFHAVGYALKDYKEKEFLLRTLRFWQWLKSLA